MTEFLILGGAWFAFLVFISRKGMAHLLAPVVGFALPVAGGLAAALLEALPFEPATPGFTARTLIAVLAGVFAGRLFGKIAKLWAMAHERRNAGNPLAAKPRLVHPLIAAGMLLAGIPALWHVISANHSFIEEELTPRDATTGIAHGFEEIRLPAEGPDAALLLHDLYASPADFGELPAQLHARGFDVFAPLLPGHGRKPDDLDRVWAEDYRRAARAAYDALAAKHTRVVIVGTSFGGTLAVYLAAERGAAALVLANPFVGRLVTPGWCPVAYEKLLGPMSRAVRRRIFEGDGLSKTYVTQSLHAARQARDLAATLDAAAAKVTCPVTVLVGDRDGVLPPQAGIDWAASHLAPTVVRLPGAAHTVFVGTDAASAVEETLRFIAK